VGYGCAVGDYDNDGWADLYVTNYGKNRLFHNNHDGTFADAAETAGVQVGAWSAGATFGDYDGDGRLDIFVDGYAKIDLANPPVSRKGNSFCLYRGIEVMCGPRGLDGEHDRLFHNNGNGTFSDVSKKLGVANFGKNRLYHNNHDGTFRDVAEKAGVTLGNWSDGATFGDYDGDGRLDLFVSGYVHADVKNQPSPWDGSTVPAFCQMRGEPVECGPRGLPGEPDHLFHNNGDGTFTDVSVNAGVADTDKFYGFTSIFVDVNSDGKLDLLVANDSQRNYLYINKGDGTFDDQSYISGFALNGDGREIASMGVAVGDYLNNGRVDILVTDFSDDYKALYRNDGDASFTEVARDAGIRQVAVPFVGWGDGLIDFDNDGWKDIMMVNGHVYPQVDQHPEWGTTYAERPLLFRNLHNGKFEYIPPVKGSGLAVLTRGRGAAFGDLFNNGRIDVVINPVDGPPVLLENVNPDHHHWLEFNLIGGPKSPRDAVGTTVYLTTNGLRQREDVMSGGSYISSNDQRPHFGLGDTTAAGSAEIRWPSGEVDTIKLAQVDRIYTITEGKAITSVFCPAHLCSSAKARK
jgi:enediyne biosynthesis protein E4